VWIHPSTDRIRTHYNPKETGALIAVVGSQRMKLRLVSLAVGVVIALVLAEMAGVAVHFVETGTSFYGGRSRDSGAEGVGRTASADPDGLDLGGRIQLANRAHPFFGFVKFRNPEKQVNLQGFVAAPRDYPLAKTDAAEYFIGIFGGSVAARFSSAGSARLIARLKQVPSFRDREIRVLNFASGGYKQPQQLLILSYYLATGQALDMAINIDGFNEVALSRLNNEHGIDLAMPSADHILPIANLLDAETLTPERIESLARIYRCRDAIASLEARAARAPLAIVYLVEERWRRILVARLWKEMLAYQGLADGPSGDSLFYVYPAVRRLGDTELYEIIAQQWSDASLMMGQLLRGRGIPYYHFLQPNQYHSGKAFGAEEASVALRLNHPYRMGAEKGYPVLEAKADALKRGGVHFFSAVPLFDAETRPIYKDDCCHLNQTGNDLLADFVAASILDDPDR
jgi:hypothetical protein